MNCAQCEKKINLRRAFARSRHPRTAEWYFLHLRCAAKLRQIFGTRYERIERSPPCVVYVKPEKTEGTLIPPRDD